MVSSQPIFPARAISAQRGGRPPSEMSWTALALPVSINLQDVAAPFGGKIDGGSAGFKASHFAQPERLAEVRTSPPSSQIASPAFSKTPIVAITEWSSISPTPMAGVGENGRAAASRSHC